MSEVVNPEIASKLIDSEVYGQMASAANKLLNRRVRTEKEIFDKQNAPDIRERLEFQGNNPEAFVEKFWEDKITAFLVDFTSFGRYCHGDGDLLSDFLKHWEITISYSELEPILSHISGDVIEEYEAKHCSFCNDELSEGEE